MADAAYAEGDNAARPSRRGERPVSAEHAMLLRLSYRQIEPASDLVATLFFRRLNEIAPDVQPLLSGNEAEQRRQLLVALGLAVAALERFEDILPALKLLGAKYRGLGVTEVHYGAVGEALLWTLRQSLGAHWSADVQDAWTALCTLVAETMTETG